MKTGNEIWRDRNPYIWVGLCLLIVGVALVLMATLVLGFLVWLAALGICLLILSFIMLALAEDSPGHISTGESSPHGNGV